MKVIIDADACPRPVFRICKEVSQKYKIELWTIASFNHNIVSDNHITVDSSSQAADIKIMNIVSKGDIVVTQDWGLAAMILGKEAKCIGVNGKEYKNSNIEFLLEERETKAKLRRNGKRVKGSVKKSFDADNDFTGTLVRLIEETQ